MYRCPRLLHTPAISLLRPEPKLVQATWRGLAVLEQHVLQCNVLAMNRDAKRRGDNEAIGDGHSH